ncbi:MAG: hypothetical protein IKQ95_09950 [Synergistaceae bacterium]|nr:hypothetical protein [Synergistaceae bacterium]
MLAILYNSVTLGMLISVCLFLNEWLEMRVNIGWVFFGLSGLLFLLQTVIKPLRKFCATFTASAFSLAVSCSGIFLLLGSEGVKIIPASIIREGLMINRVSFATINTAMIAFAVIGLILIYVTRERK